MNGGNKGIDEDQWQRSMREMRRELFGDDGGEGDRSRGPTKRDGKSNEEKFSMAEGMTDALEEDWFDEEHYARHFSSYDELKRIRNEKKKKQQQQQQETPPAQDGGGQQQYDNNNNMKRTRKSLNPYLSALRQFFLRVHPDFFHGDRERQSVNSRSFQQLNELMNWVNKLKSKKKMKSDAAGTDAEMMKPPFLSAEFKFYVRERAGEASKDQEERGTSMHDGLDDLDIAPDAEDEQESQIGKDGVRLITAHFELDHPLWSDTASSVLTTDFVTRQRKDLIAEFSVDKCMIALLTQADIEISPEMREELQNQREAYQRAVRRDASRGVVMPGEKELLEEEDDFESIGGYSENIRYLREEFRLALRNNLQGKGNAQIMLRRRGKDALEEESWWDSELPTVDELIDAKQLYFSKQLSPQQSMGAIHRLRATIHDMQCFKWRNNPIVFTNDPDRFYTISAGSFINLPCDYSVDTFNEFIDQNEEALKEKSRDNLGKARTIEALIAYVKRELKLHDLELHCNVDDAIAFLQRLVGRVDPKRPLARKKPSIYVAEIKSKFPLQDMILRIIPSSAEAEGETADTTAFKEREQKTRINLDDGALELRCDLTGNQVLQFLAYCGRERLEKCRKLTKTLTDIRDRCMMLGADLVKSIGCREIDITSDGSTPDGRQLFQHISLTDKLEFLQELEKLVARLQVYDWRHYRFIMVSDNYFKTTAHMKYEMNMSRRHNHPDNLSLDFEDDEFTVAEFEQDLKRTVLVDDQDGEVVLTVHFNPQEMLEAADALYEVSILERESVSNPLRRKIRLAPNELDQEKLTMELAGSTMKLMNEVREEEEQALSLEKQVQRMALELEEEDERNAQMAEYDDTVINDPEGLLDESDWDLKFLSDILFRNEIGTIRYGEWESGRSGPDATRRHIL